MKVTNTHYYFFRHQFGQWTMRDIVDNDGIEYNCCEQYMMFQKAMLFDDFHLANEILDEHDPYKQQQLGRNVGHFNQHIWDQYKIEIVRNGNILKFTQHEDLKKRLLETGNRVLVEANPKDSVWGVGLDCYDPRILNDMLWRGQNLLGIVLMSVRDSLKRTSKINRDELL